MALSVVASIFEARGSALRSWVPQFAMFAGLGRWIAAGLTAISSLAPNFVSAASLASPRPFTISSVTADSRSTIEAPVPPGFARVQRGESIETFAQRLLGDANRWPELWELNKDQRSVPTAKHGRRRGRSPPDGTCACLPMPCRLCRSRRWRSSDRRAGRRRAVGASAWTLRENLTVVDEYEVVEGDSYWGIAERFLPSGSPEREVWEFTQALMTFNAPGSATTIRRCFIPATSSTSSRRAGSDAGPSRRRQPSDGRRPSHTVVAGDSYWEIAEATLGDDAAPRDVLQLTTELVDLNSPRSDYGDQRMIHPGDVVYLADAASTIGRRRAATVGLPAKPTRRRRRAASDRGRAVDDHPPPTTSTTSTTSTSTLPPPPDPVGRCGRHRRRPRLAVVADRARPGRADRHRHRRPRGGTATCHSCGRPSRRRALPLPNPDAAATERMLRRLDAGERLLRVDIALRAAAAELADGDQRIVVVRCAPDGTVEFTSPGRRRSRLRGPAPAPGGRCRGVCLSTTSPRERPGRRSAMHRPHPDRHRRRRLGRPRRPGSRRPAGGRRRPEPADGVVRALAIGLASSEFAEVAHLVGVGIDEEAFLGHRHAQVVPTVDEAIELAATLIGGSATTTTRSTFSLRARHTGGEMWEPAVVIVAAAHAADLSPAVPGRSPPGADWQSSSARRRRRPWTLRHEGRVVARTARDPAAAGGVDLRSSTTSTTSVVDRRPIDDVSTDQPVDVGPLERAARLRSLQPRRSAERKWPQRPRRRSAGAMLVPERPETATSSTPIRRGR